MTVQMKMNCIVIMGLDSANENELYCDYVSRPVQIKMNCIVIMCTDFFF